MSGTSFSDRLVMTASEVCATILPTIGGSLGALTWRGRSLLRRASLQSTDARDTACFPLLPFANRIADGKFLSNGTRICIPSDGPGAPHALHGVGWTAPWRVVVAAGDRAELRLEHNGPAWPWRFEACQTFQLVDRGIRILLELTNRDSSPMPAGIGFHPYFERTNATKLHMQITHGWSPDVRGIAAMPLSDVMLAQLTGRARVATLARADLCCGGWRHRAIVDQGDMKIAVDASPILPFLHLYVPEDAPFFCAEPVSHAPDAPNRVDVPPMTMLAPGATLSGWVSITGCV